MYIKSFLKDSTTVVLHINKLLDCKGNRDLESNGIHGYINSLGITDAKCKSLFGFNLNSLFSKILGSEELDSELVFEVKINEVDYESIREEVFSGLPLEDLVPLNDDILRNIL
jgi:hypothetical protein